MTYMGDGNERAMVDEQFQQQAISNEGRILSLEQYVTGKGGIFNLMQELKQQLGDLSKNFDDKMGKFDDRMDGFDRELQEVKRIVNEEKNLRVDKENKALEAKKPVMETVWKVIQWAVIFILGIIATAVWVTYFK